MQNNRQYSTVSSVQSGKEFERITCETAMDSLLALVRSSLRVPMVVIAIRGPDDEFVVWGEGFPEALEESETQRFVHSISKRLSKVNGRPVTISDVRSEPAAAAIQSDDDISVASIAVTSLPKSPKELCGFVCVGDIETRRWADEDIQWLNHAAALAEALIKKQLAPFNDGGASSRNAVSESHGHEQRYRLIFENNFNAAFSIDTYGYIREVNQACERLTGYTAAELCEMTFWQLIPPELQVYASSLFQVALDGSPTDWNLNILCRDGNRVEVQGTIVPIVVGGETVGILGVAHDNTEQKRADAAVRESEALLRAQAEASVDGIMIVSPDGRILSYNQRFIELWDIPRDIMEAGSILEARHAVLEKLVDPEKFVDDIQFLYENPEDVRRDEVQLKNGRLFARFTAPVRDEHGFHYGRGWYYRDMTERRRMEQGLREEAQRLSSLVTNNPELVVELDLRGTFLSVNPSCKMILGYEPEELLGCHFTDIARLENFKFIRDQLEQVACGEVCDFELTAHHKAGHSVDLSMQLIPIILDEQVIGFWAVGEDLTNIKLMAHMLQSSEARLLKAQQIAHIGSWDWDVPSGVVRWSPETFRIFGHDVNAFEPTFDFFMDAVHSEDRKSVTEALSSTLQSQGPYGIDIRVVRADGTERWIHAQGEITGHHDNMPIHMSGTVMDITGRKLLETELAYHAFNDPLTRLANRRWFMDRLNQALARANRYSSSVGLLYIDLDDFKTINDSLGHSNGDGLLIMVAERLQECVRDTDTVARLGGDEFVILVEGDIGPNRAVQVAERILERVKDPFILSGMTVNVSPSIGVIPHILPGTEPDDLLRSADLAMYKAKHSGKTRYEIFDMGE